MDVNVRYYVSSNSDREKRSAENMAYLREVGERAGLVFHLDDPVLNAPEVVFIGGGGTEGQFKAAVDELEDPVIILTTGENNSLAASMEILSYFQQEGRRGLILHGDLEETASRLQNMLQAKAVLKKLNGFRLGSLGRPSDWLISSHVNPTRLKEVCGMEIVDIEMEEVFAEIARGGYPDNEFVDDLKKHSFDPKELEKALDIYGAFVRIKEKYQLQALTVRCFDLLEPVKNTGCLGLAILNAQGIYGGCEGDMPSLISMAILGELSGKPVFMCNPSRILRPQKEMVLAHCTLPLNMPCQYRLMTHYESGLGVAVAGEIPQGECTVFKCSGDLSRHFAARGRIVANLHEDALCRTQIQVHLEEGLDYFTTRPIGNHHCVCCGDVTGLIEEFFNLC